MYARGSDLVSFLKEYAPPDWALPGDPTGLQWGNLDNKVSCLLLALDFSEAVLGEALAVGASFIFTHHPFLYRPLYRLDLNNKHEALVARALKEDITLYSAHTNLDVSPRGVSYALGSLLGLKNMTPLSSTGKEAYQKLVVFVPEGYEDRVREAISEAGAGWIGNYSHCTYQSLGTGTFLPLEGSSPFLGSQHLLEKVREYRLETIIPLQKQKNVLEALHAAHPYEEVAFDLYPLSNEKQVWGLGMVGELIEQISLRELLCRCRTLLKPAYLKYLGIPGMPIERVAVLGGSGSDYIDSAIESRAQVFITGDIKFHDLQKAARLGLALIDPGHDATERPVIPVMAEYFKDRMREKKLETKVLVSKEEPESLWQIFQ
jgi:dinuclear metal center YbgI/SA1388 family protein